MRQSIIDKGVEVPDDAKIEDYAGYILQIEGGGSWDPDNPTLESLAEAIKSGKDIKIGLEIPDFYTYSSYYEHPLIVAHKLDSSNNAGYGGAEGYILVRKSVSPISQVFNGSSKSSYPDSDVFEWLNGTQLNGCTDELRQCISPFSVPYYNGSSIVEVSSMAHLISGTEMNGTPNTGEGTVWDLWKERTGLSSPSNGDNSGRIGIGQGVAQPYWLRSRKSSSDVYYVTRTGSITSISAGRTATFGILPAFFISR